MSYDECDRSFDHYGRTKKSYTTVASRVPHVNNHNIVSLCQTISHIITLYIGTKVPKILSYAEKSKE